MSSHSRLSRIVKLSSTDKQRETKRFKEVNFNTQFRQIGNDARRIEGRKNLTTDYLDVELTEERLGLAALPAEGPLPGLVVTVRSMADRTIGL